MFSVQLEILPGLNASVGGNGVDSVIFNKEMEEGSTVGDVIRKLANEYQDFGDIFFDTQTNKLSGQVTVVLNDRLLEVLKALDTEIKHGDIIRLFPLIAGG
jgi:molybdopterin converting factor small subunit